MQVLAPTHIQSLLSIHKHPDLILLQIVRRFRAGAYTGLASILLSLINKSDLFGPWPNVGLPFVTNHSLLKVRPPANTQANVG